MHWSTLGPAALTDYPQYAPKFALNNHAAALVVVDMQYCCADRASLTGAFLREHYPHLHDPYFAAVDSALLRIKDLLDAFRRSRRQVVYLTVSSNLPSGADFEPQRREREAGFETEVGRRSVLSYRGLQAARIVADLTPSEDDLVVNKVSLSAFNSTGLDQILRNLGLTALVFCGVVTNGCVMTNAIDASDRGYRTMVVQDACAALDSHLHESALFHLGHLFARIMTAEQVVAELSGLRSAADAAAT